MTATRSRKREATTAPLQIPTRIDTPLTRPEFLRLPKPGLLCPITGMTRSALNELILPTPRNNGNPPVRSFCLRQKGAKTGIRLVDYEALASYIRQHVEHGGHVGADECVQLRAQ